MALWISPLAAAGSNIFPCLCLLKSLLLPSSLPRFIRLDPNSNDVDKAKSALKKIRYDSKRFSSISAWKIRVGLYDLSQQILVSIIFFLFKLRLHIFSTLSHVNHLAFTPRSVQNWAASQCSGTVFSRYFSVFHWPFTRYNSATNCFHSTGYSDSFGTHWWRDVRSAGKVVLMTCNTKDL